MEHDLAELWVRVALNHAAREALGANPVRVVDDAGTSSQFFSWLDVDPTTGAVGVSWYDARNDTGGVDPNEADLVANTEVQYFASFSSDGGKTWSKNVQVSDGKSFGGGSPPNNFGDYTGATFYNGTFYLTWADNTFGVPSNPDGFPEAFFDRIPLINTTMADLLADINAAIAVTPALAGKIQAQADGNVVKLAAIDSSVTTLKVTTSTADPAFREAGSKQNPAGSYSTSKN